MQYFIPFVQFSIALDVYPNLQSIHNGAHKVQQHELQYMQANPYASTPCQASIQQAAL